MEKKFFRQADPQRGKLRLFLLGALESAIHRLRARHRQLLREEVAQTVLGPSEVDEEIRNLISVVSA